MLNWKLIKKELKSAPWEWDEFYEDYVREVFIGNLRHLHPSGVAYDPWDKLPSKCTGCDTWFVPYSPCYEKKCKAPHGYDGPEYHCLLCQDGAFHLSILLEGEKHGLLIEDFPGGDHDLMVREKMNRPKRKS